MNTKLLGWNGYVYDFLFILTDKLQSNNGLNKQNSRGNDRPRPQIRFPLHWFQEMLSVSSLFI